MRAFFNSRSLILACLSRIKDYFQTDDILVLYATDA